MFGRVRQETDLEELPPIAPRRPGGDRRLTGRRGGDGPFDVEDPGAGIAEDGVEGYLDFGSLRVPIPTRAQLQVEKGSGELLRAVHVLVPSGRVSLSALAAPRSTPLWRGLAEEIAASLSRDGARVRSEWGTWGREVQAGSNGALSRFIGVDGERWMLYGVATGPAEGAPELADTLREMIRGTVVSRGPDPLPVKTVLPLRLPEHLEERVERAREASARLPSQDTVVPLGRTSMPPAPARQPMRPRRMPSGPRAVPPVSTYPPVAAVPPAGHSAPPRGAASAPGGPARSIGSRPVDQPRRPVPPPVAPRRPGGLPPVPAHPTLDTNGVPRASVESTWSSANPVVSADQLAQQPAWALLGQAPTFWPDERFPAPRSTVPVPPDRGAPDDAGAWGSPSPVELTLPLAPVECGLPLAVDEPAGPGSPNDQALLSTPDSLHLALTDDSAVTRDRLATPDWRGRHRRTD